MKWIEMIGVRTAGGNQEILESKLQGLLFNLGKKGQSPDMLAYTRALVDTDFSIHLMHDSNKVNTGGSRLGLRLVNAFKEFGLVNHSIWIEMPREKKKKDAP